MTDRSVTHATFTVERRYPAAPSRVFAAWEDPEAKARWFGGDDFTHEHDFRVGGREVSSGNVDGTVFTYEGRYQDIVPDERIVYAYDMHMGEARISVSLATVELKPDGEGTRLVFTEQGAFLDGLDDPAQRESGTGTLLDQLARELER
jgi:uncharacterized protein YndB with AHSA1/START domain